MEENLTAEEIEQEVQRAEKDDAETAESVNEGTNDIEFEDSEETDESREKSTEDDKKVKGETKSEERIKSDRETEFARKRRERERRLELNKARVEAVIEAMGGINPYTNERMEDSEDVEEYLLMKKIEKDGGDPVSDYSKALKADRKRKYSERVQRVNQEKWYEDDREKFVKEHPNIDLDELIRNERFKRFASGKVGAQPLSDIYEDYLAFESDIENTAKRKAAQIIANGKSSVGSLKSSNTEKNDYFTEEQVRKMTQSEVDKNYDKIISSMKKWRKK